MKVRHLIVLSAALFALALPTTWAATQRPNMPQGRPPFEKFLAIFDQNSDDQLEQSELPPPVWDRMSQADGNGDGIVTKQEYDSFIP